MRVDALDFREGGAYRFVYTLPDRSVVGIGGVYRTIRPPERLVFSWIIDVKQWRGWAFPLPVFTACSRKTR